jgi:hypothetical protein
VAVQIDDSVTVGWNMQILLHHVAYPPALRDWLHVRLGTGGPRRCWAASCVKTLTGVINKRDTEVERAPITWHPLLLQGN